MNFEECLQEKLAEPEFRRAWEEDEPAFRIVRLLVSARAERGWTQAELARQMGTDQANASRAETTGRVTPDFLVRFLEATGGSATLTVRTPGSKVTRLDVGILARGRGRTINPPAAVSAKRSMGQKLRRLRVKNSSRPRRKPEQV
jgi:transcriptional regulator with XRE-family HTH domain